MAVVVHVYGVPPVLHGERVRLPAEVDEQLSLAHCLREDLVTLEHQRQDAVTAVWSSYPQIAAIETQLTAAETELTDRSAAAAAERSAARKKGPTESSEAVRQLKARIKDLRSQRRTAIADAHPTATPRLTAIADAHRAAIKALYADYSQGRGLYWATYNDVVAHHQVATKRVAAERKAGRPANIRHHRYDGSGSITVQLQRQTGAPPRLPATIADEQNGPWRNVLYLTPWVDPDTWATLARAEQRRRRLGVVRLALGNKRHLSIPVLVHRMLPADADITSARLVVRRVAGHRKIELHVTARIKDPVTRSGGPAVALHLGWRREDGGAVRVATWRSTAPVHVPDDLNDLVHADTDHTGTISLPARWWHRVSTQPEMAARRATSLNDIRDQLVAALTDNPLTITADDEDAQPVPTAAAVATWRSPARFAHLARTWATDCPAGHQATAAALENWRRSDRRLWEQQAHGTANTLAARADAYRRTMSWLLTGASRLVLDNTAIADLARRADPATEPTLPTAVTDRVAHQRIGASPGQLRSIATTTANSYGVAVAVMPHTGITRTHYRCGHLNPADDRYSAARIVTCDGCGQHYDQESSATLMLLAASGDVAAPGSATARNPDTSAHA